MGTESLWVSSAMDYVSFDKVDTNMNVNAFLLKQGQTNRGIWFTKVHPFCSLITQSQNNSTWIRLVIRRFV